jgi:hypothetical protein
MLVQVRSLSFCGWLIDLFQLAFSTYVLADIVRVSLASVNVTDFLINEILLPPSLNSNIMHWKSFC